MCIWGLTKCAPAILKLLGHLMCPSLSLGNVGILGFYLGDSIIKELPSVTRLLPTRCNYCVIPCEESEYRNHLCKISNVLKTLENVVLRDIWHGAVTCLICFVWFLAQNHRALLSSFYCAYHHDSLCCVSMFTVKTNIRVR